MSDSNQKEKILENYYLLYSIYSIRKNIPTSKIFYLVMYFFKYIGALICSRIPEKEINKNYFSLDKYLSGFLIFGKDYSLACTHYVLISIIIFVFLMIFIIFSSIFFNYMKVKFKNITTLYDYTIADINRNKKLEDNLYQIISFILIIIIFTHQYIVEYLFFGVYFYFFYLLGEFSDDNIQNNNYNKTIYNELYQFFNKSNNVNNITIIFIINLISIIFIIILLFIFLLFNSVKCLFLNYGMSYCGNNTYLVIKIILFTSQPFYSFVVIYDDQKNIIIGLIFDGIIIVLSLLNFFICFQSFGYYPGLVTNLSFFFEILIFISAAGQIFIWLINIGNNNNTFIVTRIFIEIIDSVFLYILFIYIKNIHNENLFTKNIFDNSYTDLSIGSFYYFFEKYQIYIQNKNRNYLQLFRLFLKHFNNCQKIDCPGKKLIPQSKKQSLLIPATMTKNNSNELNKLNISNDTILSEEGEKNEKPNKIINNTSIIIDENKLSDKQFQMIFEQEIINVIDFCYRKRNYPRLENFIFIHLQYLLKIKRNFSLSLYYAGKYFSCGLKFSLTTKYFLYEYKKFILETLEKNTSNRDLVYLHEVINYFNCTSILVYLVIISCEKLRNLFNFRKDLHDYLTLKAFKCSQTDNLILSGEKLKNYINTITYLLKKHYIEYKRKIESQEIAYILSNYYILILKKIPYEVRQYIDIRINFNSIVDKLEAGFKSFNLIHPLILALTVNNTFNINYLSNLICIRLGFKKNELIYKDFHEKIFPGLKFKKEHELIMKQFLFFNSDKYNRKNSFLKSKDGYLTSIKFNLRKLPVFFDDFFYIVDIDFNDELYNSEVNHSYNRYSFLLDEDFEFLYHTKNFYEEYGFNVFMFKEIQMNFTDFFCVDKNQLCNEIEKLKSSAKSYNCQFKYETDTFTIFKNVNYQHIFELRDIDKLEKFSCPIIVLKSKIDKNKIMMQIPEFAKYIEEYGLDYQWYTCLENFRRRLNAKDFIEENKESYDISRSKSNEKSDASSSYKKNEIIKNTFFLNSQNIANMIKIVNDNNTHINEKNKSERNIKHRKFFDSNIYVKIDRSFDTVYNLRQLGSSKYYIVDIYEETKYLKDNLKKSFEDLSEDENNNNSKYYYQNSSISSNKEIRKQKITDTKKNDYENSFSLFDDSNVNNKKSMFNKDFQINKNFNKAKTANNKLKFENKIIVLYKESSLFDENSDNNKEIGNNSRKNQVHVKKDSMIDNIPITEKNRKNKNNRNNFCLDDSSSKNKILSTTNIVLPKVMKNSSKKDPDLAHIKFNEYRFSKKLNSYINIKKNKKNDDEEQTSLISQNELEIFINQNSFKNRILSYSLFIILILSIILIIIKLMAPLLSSYSINSNLINELIYIELIKNDVYTTAILSLSQCIYDDSTGPMLFQSQSIKLKNHLSSFENLIKSMRNSKLTENIFNSLYSNITIYNLNNDWTERKLNSNFLKEINFMTYELSMQISQLNRKTSCKFENSFYDLFNTPSEKIYNKVGTPNNVQKLVYYIFMNFLTEYKHIFEKITNEINILQKRIMNNFYMIIMIISICLGVLIFVFEIIVIIKIKLDMKFIRKILLYFYKYTKKHLQFENEICFLENTAKEFTIDNINVLENVKKNINYKNIINTKIEKKNTSSISNNDNKSMNGSITNNTNSVIKLTNSNNKNNVNNNGNINNNKSLKHFVNEDILFKENSDTIYMIKINKRMVPTVLFISPIISLILIILYLVLFFLNIKNSVTNNELWTYSIYLLLNIEERIPKLIELTLACLFYVTGGQSNEKFPYLENNEYLKIQYYYLKYFSKFNGYDNEGFISDEVEDSFFSNILADNLRIKTNINYCLTIGKYKKYFAEYELWNKKLNDVGYFCCNAAMGASNLFRSDFDTLYDYFLGIEMMTQYCIAANPDIVDSGLDTEINYMHQELIYSYKDYINNNNISNARSKFFENKNNIRIIGNMNIPFSMAFSAMTYACEIDIVNIYENIKKDEEMFIIVIIIFNVVIICLLIISFYFIEKNKKILTFFAEILKRN